MKKIETSLVFLGAVFWLLFYACAIGLCGSFVAGVSSWNFSAALFFLKALAVSFVLAKVFSAAAVHFDGVKE